MDKGNIDHTIPDLLQARAKKLGLLITADADHEEGLDFGPFFLCCEDGYHHIWDYGLPLEGIADALNCFERERKLPDEEIGKAWRDFGARWRPRRRRYARLREAVRAIASRLVFFMTLIFYNRPSRER